MLANQRVAGGHRHEGLGNGLEGYVSDSFSSRGTNTLTVMVLSRGSTRTMEVEDVYGIVAENSQYLDLCSPTASLSGSVKVGADTTSSSVTGVSEDYFSIQGYEVSRGRGLQYSDIATRTKVCGWGLPGPAYFAGTPWPTLAVGGQS
jgi:putative ABC transport system permease protein